MIELLVAFAFVALAAVSLLGLVRQSLRMMNASQDMSAASQAALAPGLGPKDLGARTREMRSEQVELGPIRFRSVLLEIVPEGRSEGIQVRVYK